MIQGSNSSSGLRPRHTATVVVTVAVAAIVAFWAFHFVLGIVAFFVKLAIVVAVLYGVTRFVLHRAKK